MEVVAREHVVHSEDGLATQRDVPEHFRCAWWEYCWHMIGRMPFWMFVWHSGHRRGNTLVLMTVAVGGCAAAPPELRKQTKPWIPSCDWVRLLQVMWKCRWHVMQTIDVVTQHIDLEQPEHVGPSFRSMSLARRSSNRRCTEWFSTPLPENNCRLPGMQLWAWLSRICRSFGKGLDTGRHEKAPVRCLCSRLAAFHGALLSAAVCNLIMCLYEVKFQMLRNLSFD